ncbi:MAG: nitrogenase component 1, partial [Methanomassiliicoccales archaeon]
MTISNSQNVVPTREARLNSVIAFGGTGKELVRSTKQKCLKQLDRGFSQCAACDEMMPLINSALIEGNVVVAHSPIGCASILANIPMFKNIGRGLRGQNPDIVKIISTNLGEDSVVFGGVSNLEEAILEAERRYHPPMITIITSCATGIIGDNIESVVSKVQPKVKATIVPMHCEGFRSGVVSTGYDAFLISLMKMIEEPKNKRSDTLLVVNPFTIARANEVEIERILAKIGIKVQWFPLFTDVENIRNASEVGGIATLCNLMSNY